MEKLIIDWILVIFIYFFICFPKWKNNTKKLFWNTLMFIYVFIILAYTILPGWDRFITGILSFNIHDSNINMVPFVDIINGHSGAYKEVYLNILLFVPFGLLYCFQRKARFLDVFFVSFLFSLTIESVQLLLDVLNIYIRIFDITDLISNTVGGILGYFIYRAVYYVYRQIFR
ncbi:MAG: VanZ family protein [Erysipelotrichaceae bacterium]